MRCISLWQPWASLWLIGCAKEFETRHWPTAYRGPLLVHAAKSSEGKTDMSNPVFQLYLRKIGINKWEDLPRGGIIGRVDLIACELSQYIKCKRELDEWDILRGENKSTLNENELDFGDWSPGRFVWQRAPNPLRFKEIIPYKGQQGFFDVPEEIIANQEAILG